MRALRPHSTMNGTKILPPTSSRFYWSASRMSQTSFRISLLRRANFSSMITPTMKMTTKMKPATRMARLFPMPAPPCGIPLEVMTMTRRPNRALSPRRPPSTRLGKPSQTLPSLWIFPYVSHRFSELAWLFVGGCPSNIVSNASFDSAFTFSPL